MEIHFGEAGGFAVTISQTLGDWLGQNVKALRLQPLRFFTRGS